MEEEEILPYVELPDWTGEVKKVQIHDSEEESREKYSVWRLYMRIWNDGYDFVMLKSIRSEGDMRMFLSIKSSINEANEVIINAGELASMSGTSRASAYNLIKRLISIGFLHRIARGVYKVNPYVYCSSKAWNAGGSRHISELQKWWWNNVGIVTQRITSGTSSLHEATV